MKLTEHLLSLDTDNFKKATEHEFLKQVGQLQVQPEHLKSWLIQDRFYTGGYVNMMGAMVSRLALFEDQRELGDNDPSYSVEQNQRILKTLSFALSNVYREANFFTTILNKPCYSEIDHPVKQKETTSRYIEFEKKVARESGYDLGEALIVLWAMEKVFFTAWNYAKSINQNISTTKEESLHIQSCRELMENWTIPEFEEFVDDCAALVDQLSTNDPRRLASFEKTYRDCLALEVLFWEMAYQ